MSRDWTATMSGSAAQPRHENSHAEFTYSKGIMISKQTHRGEQVMTKVIQYAGKQKKALLAGALVIILTAVIGIFIYMDFPLSASGISEYSPLSFHFFTNDTARVSLPLTESADADDNLAVFTRSKNVYTFVSCMLITEGAKSATLSNLNLVDNVPVTYYVTVTKLTSAEVQTFDQFGGNSLPNTNSTTLTIGDAELQLQEIQVELDNGGPQITGAELVSEKLLKTDNLVIKFSVTDEKAGVNTSSIQAAAVYNRNPLPLLAVTASATELNVYSVSISMSSLLSEITDFGVLPSLKLDVTAEDNLGNKAQPLSVTFSNIEYISMKEISMYSSNSDKTVAKREDTVYVCVTTDDSVDDSDFNQRQIAAVNVSRPTLSKEENHKKYWQFSYYITNQTNNSLVDGLNIPFGITLGENGHDIDITNQDSTTSVKYSSSILITGLTYASTPSGASVAVPHDVTATTGDKITVTFTTQQDINLRYPMIAGKNAGNIQSPTSYVDGIKTWTWTFSYTIETNAMVTPGVIPFSFTISKTISNSTETKDYTQDDCANDEVVTYVLPFQVSFTDILSDNSMDNHTAASTNMVMLNFTTDAGATVSSATVAGRTAKFSKIVNIDGSIIVNIDGSINWSCENIPCSDLSTDGKVPFVIDLTDASGNRAHMTQDTVQSFVMFYGDINAQITAISSNNDTNTSYVKNGDTITVLFSTRHSITMDSLVCENSAGTLTVDAVPTQMDSDGKAWKLQFAVTGNMFDNNSSPKFVMNLKDASGQIQTLSYSQTGVLTYLAPIGITALNVSSNNIQGGGQVAHTGNTITIKYTTVNAATLPDMKINGQLTDYSNYVNADGNRTWTLQYVVTEGMYSGDTTVGFSIGIIDDAGNIETITEQTAKNFPTPSSVSFFSDIQVTNVQVQSSNPAVTPIAVINDTVTIDFDTQHVVSITSLVVDNISISDYTATGTDSTGHHWTISYKVTDGMYSDNTAVQFCVNTKDESGNLAQVTSDEGTAIIYFAPLIESGVINDLVIETDNQSYGNNSGVEYAKDGNTVTVSFQTSHPIETPAGIIAGSTANFTNDMQDKMTWKAMYVLPENAVGILDIQDNTDLQFSLIIKDAGGNTASKTQTDTKAVRYLAPIADGLSSLSFASDNTGTSGQYAKNGNTVTLQFSTSHLVNLENAVMENAVVVFSCTDDTKVWTYTVTVPVADLTITDNSDIRFSFNLNDAAGNTPISETQDNVPKVRFQAPITIHNLLMQSNNANSSSLSSNGDIITVQFETKHPVVLTDSKIAGQAVSFSSLNNDSMHWTAVYITADKITADNAYISLAVHVGDLAGNDPVVLTENSAGITPVKYYAPIAITNLMISTTNTKNGAQFARDEDVVTVSFTTNHDVAVGNARIAENSVSQTKTDSTTGGIDKSYSLVYIVNNNNMADLSTVSFALTLTDAAGNTPVSRVNTDADVKNSIQYFAPITAVTSVSSGGKNISYAKNGDTVTLSVTANHNVTVQTASILGKPAKIAGDNTVKPSLSYTIPSTENIIKEGAAEFTYTVADEAGNVFQTAQTNDPSLSQVIYDRTNPGLAVTPLFNGYTNESVTYKIDFSDTNPDKQGMSVKLNGVEQIAGSDRAAMSGSTFTKTITVASDDIYSLTASVADMAGNLADPDYSSKITIDKTNPTVTSKKIAFDKPQVYKSGFVLGDYIDIEDTNVSEVVCMLTDSDGSRDWALETPITKDGKKTIYLLAKDFAGNASNEVVFDIYIDATMPKPIVTDEVSSVTLLQGNNEAFISKMTLNIRLQDINVGNESADKFTSLKLTDSNGNLVTDILGTMNPGEDGSYSVAVASFGTYTLLIEAEDDVGNKTEKMQYTFQFKDKSILQKYFDNKPVFYSTTAAAAVIAAGAAVFLIMRRRYR